MCPESHRAVGDGDGSDRGASTTDPTPSGGARRDNPTPLSVLRNTSRPAIVFDPNPGLTFAGRPVGTTSASQTVTISNLGAAPLLISSIQPGGPDADEYSVSGDRCSGAPVVPGAICQVSVRFTPVTEGAAIATLLAVSSAPTSPGGVPLMGTATPAPPPPAGAPGAPGAPGTNGAPGAKGDPGSSGAKGDSGTNGLNGAAGPGGPKGDQGPQGPAGKNGRDAVVTCKVARARRGKVKVTCTVRFRAGAGSARVRARITRGHRHHRVRAPRHHRAGEPGVGRLLGPAGKPRRGRLVT
jgi:hypothetical protein